MNWHRAPKKNGRGRLSVGGVVLLILILAALRGYEALNPPDDDLVPDATQTRISATTEYQPTGAPLRTAQASGTPEARPTSSAPRTASGATPASAAGGTAGLGIATPQPGDRMPTVGVAQLASQAQETLRLIAAGGPFPYQQDGVTFQNREKLLPTQAEGYYKEYTVVTPGSPDRGARRIIGGREHDLYYTDDHYATFKRIVP